MQMDLSHHPGIVGGVVPVTQEAETNNCLGNGTVVPCIVREENQHDPNLPINIMLVHMYALIMLQKAQRVAMTKGDDIIQEPLTLNRTTEGNV